MQDLSKTLVKELFTSTMIMDSTPLKAFIDSSVFGRNPEIAKTINSMSRGTTFEVPMVVKDFTDMEERILDDSSTVPDSYSLNTVEAKVALGFYGQAFGQYDITKMIGVEGTDTVGNIVNFIGDYWKERLQKRAISILQGATAANIANEASDSVLDDSANEISFAQVVNAAGKTGENVNAFDTILMHPETYQKLVILDDTKLTKLLDLTKTFYNGLKIIVSKEVPVDATTITTYLLKAGSFIIESANVDYPLEFVRTGKGGNLGGVSEVISRLGIVLHLNGYSYLKAAQAGISPTVAELANPANWERKVNAENSPFVALISKR